MSNPTPHEFHALVENALDAIAIIDLEGKVIYGNRACYNAFGYDCEKEELVGQALTSFWPRERAPFVAKDMQSQMRAGGWQGEMFLKRKDGSLFEAYTTVFSLTDEAGKTTSIGSIFRDITARKRAEKALQDSEARYRSLFEDSPIALWEQDYSEYKAYIDKLVESGVKDFRKYFKDHPEEVNRCANLVKVVEINQATLDLYKAKSKEEFHANLSRVLVKGVYDSMIDSIIAITEGKTHCEIETINRTFTGEEIHIVIRWYVAPGYEDTWSKVFVSIVDLTEHKRMEGERDRLQQEIIETQRQALRELSTPIVPVLEGVLVLPLVGSIDTRRAQQIMETLLEAIGRHQAEVVLIDITGVPVVDTGVAYHLLQVTHAASLLGSACVLVGISPEVAQTIVSMGVDLSEIATRSNLQSGIAYALSKMGKEISEKSNRRR